MKGRKKFEKGVVGERKKVGGIRGIEINWGLGNWVEDYGEGLGKGGRSCMDWGDSWVMREEREDCRCGECGGSLKVWVRYEGKVREKEYLRRVRRRGE